MPVLCSDRPGIDWRELYRRRVEAGVCETDTAAVPLAQLLAVWGEPDADDNDGTADGGGLSRTEMLAKVNRLRRKNGLPPVEPQGWEPDPGVDWRAEGGDEP